MSKPARGSIPVRILVMGRHFLYLPLYVAQFDSPKDGKLPWFGKVPPQYDIEVKPPENERDQNDRAVFGLLTKARPGESDIMFAACDPTVLLPNNSDNALLAAALIGSSAFWAVNHDARNVRLVSDLASFDTILCYEPGTTSNLIARRIAKKDGKKLKVVPATEEIPQLEKLGEGALALSPEVLKIANLVHGELRPGEKQAKIVYTLSTTKEFSNVLTTALFTRPDVLDHHRELVSGVLTALQTALLAIHAGDPVVKAAAKSNFSDAYHLDEALELAANGYVFPETIQVRRDRWQRACEFFFISQALADDREKASLTKAEQVACEELYTKTVLDRTLQRIVAESIARGFGDLLGHSGIPSSTPLKRRLQTAFMLAGTFIAGLISALILNGSAVVIAVTTSWAMAIAVGWALAEAIGYKRRSLWYATHWLLFIMSWWTLHELAIPRALAGANFVPGMAMDANLASGLLTVSSGLLTGAGFYVRSKVSRHGIE